MPQVTTVDDQFGTHTHKDQPLDVKINSFGYSRNRV